MGKKRFTISSKVLLLEKKGDATGKGVKLVCRKGEGRRGGGACEQLRPQLPVPRHTTRNHTPHQPHNRVIEPVVCVQN